MARPKIDKRRQKRTRISKTKRTNYNNYNTEDYSRRLRAALLRIELTSNISDAARKYKIPRQTLQRSWKQYNESGNVDLDAYTQNRSQRLHVLTQEQAVEEYCLWESDRGQNLDTCEIKSVIREIHALGVERGDVKRKLINTASGPSAKYMREFYKRHPKLTNRMAERVDRGRINMANQSTIDNYFTLVKDSFVKHGIMQLDSAGEVIQDSIKTERIYMADETGWGVQTKTKKVIGRKGAKHIYNRKLSDESHKTLMLGICGNGDVLKSLIVLEKSFPLLGEGEAELLPENILLSKTKKGSMEKELFVEWLESSLILHKKQVNPDGVSFIIVDNHGSRFSTRAIDLCREHNIEVLCYPGHLTHILQGPDVVLNKPISALVERWVRNNARVSGNSDISRVAYITVINEAVEQVCTKETVAKAFSSTRNHPLQSQTDKTFEFSFKLWYIS